MKYYTSEHFREDPTEEIEAAMTYNSVESVLSTLTARLATEETHLPRNDYEYARIKQQLAYIALFTTEIEVAA